MPELNDPTVDRLARAALQSDTEAYRLIAKRLSRNPLETALFGGKWNGDHVERRLRLFRDLTPEYERVMAGFGISDPSATFLFEIIVPLTQYLGQRATEASGTFLVGIGGGPGVGKTTQSKILSACLPMMASAKQRCLSLSLDDFYFPKEERLRRGHKWRTLPGSHDTERLCAFVSSLDRRGQTLTVPRYDLGRDTPAADEVLPDTPDICIFDGAMVGARCPGYDTLADRFDFFIYLDAPIAQLQQWRFGRERKIRQQTHGQAGFTEEQMQAFWNEALQPSITQWVMPNARIADVVLEIGPDRNLLGVRRPQSQAKTEAETI